MPSSTPSFEAYAKARMRRNHRLLLASSMALSLWACGGGGSDEAPGPAPAPEPPPGPTFNERFAGASYDDDNNGTADATDTLAYDAFGRVTKQTYIYSGDGVPDLVAGLGSASFINDNTYDAAGHMDSMTTAYTSGVNTGMASITRMRYDAAGLLTRADLFDRNQAGVETASVYFTYAYVNGQRSEAVMVLGSPMMKDVYTYNADGLPTAVSKEHLLNPAIKLPRTEYDWNADRTLQTERYDADRDGVFDYVKNYSYTGGRLTRVVKTTGGADAAKPGETSTLNYDANGRLLRIDTDVGSNGSVEATRTAQFQAGLCRPVVMTMILPLVGADGFGTAADGTINFCGP